ncbi:MAG: hypothetical protein GXW99_06055 [Clostridiales bacterium]|nr:hypothetical protein [Clostridiales bacterium]
MMHDVFHPVLGETGAPCAQGCYKVGYEYADVSIPIELRPSTIIGRIETACCGEPMVTCAADPCGEYCNIIITQRIRIKIPVRYGLEAIPGSSYVECGDPPDCCNCRGK